MTEQYQTAFMLLTIGMITVFLILFLVVLISKLMILVINKYFPEVVVIGKKGAETSPEMMDPARISAIVTAIDIMTGGKGHVDKIEKI
jgi:oxaloacetate decarboxylase gamma subunit